MTRMPMIAAMFGLVVAASACTQSNPTSLAESQPVVMTDVPQLAGSSMPEPVLRPIDFHDSRAYGNGGGI